MSGDGVVAASALRPTVTLATEGKESVTTPAGSIEAWKVRMEAGQQKQWVWFEVASPNRLVKYDNGATVFLLRSK